MKAELEKLVGALREELVQYGEILALLEQQQELIVNNSTDELLENLEAITSQTKELASARGARDSCRQKLAVSLGQAPESRFRQLIEILASEHQPLVRALVDEINDLLRRAQLRLSQNNRLLGRALHVPRSSTAGKTLPIPRWNWDASPVDIAANAAAPSLFPGSRSLLLN